MISDDTIVSEANVAYVAAKFVPYTELKFIESTGTQYIDTGYKPNNNTKIEIVFWSNKSDAQSIASVDHGWRAETFGIWGTALGFGTDVNTYNDESGIARYNHDYKIDASLSQEGFYKNGVLYETFSDYTFALNYNLPLFALNRNGTIIEFSKAKLYSCKLYENNILVRDFIPVSNLYGDVGLFDLVEYKFYGNSGTGSFVAGPEAKLPDDYTEVEYVEGNVDTTSLNSKVGTYIKTDIIPSGNATCFCDFQFVTAEGSNAAAIFGTRNANQAHSPGSYAFFYHVPNKFWRWDYATYNMAHKNGEFDTYRHEVTCYQNELRYEDCDTIINTYTNFTSSYPLLLFSMGNANAPAYCSNSRIFSFEYYDDGVNRFFVPCRSSDNKYGMFELYTKTFYSNASTTSAQDFTGGEDISTERLEQPIGSASKPAFLSTITDFFGIGDKSLDQGNPLSVENLGYILDNFILGYPVRE